MNIHKWFHTSNRNKHFTFIIPIIVIFLIIPDVIHCTYIAIVAGACLELKDKLWGGKPDTIDFICTIMPGIIIDVIRYFI